MIEMLNGIKETVLYKEIEGFKLHDNTDYEVYPSHWHTPIEIIMPIENDYEIASKNESYVLHEGDILLINSGVVHGMPSVIRGERLILQVDISMLHNVADIESTLSTIPQILLITDENASVIHERLKKLMLEIYQEYFSSSILISAATYYRVIEMLVLMGREFTGMRNNEDSALSKQKEHTEKFMMVCNYIHEHYTEDLCLDNIAGLAGFSKYHFSRLFKNFTGLSFYKYLHAHRVSQPL